MRVSVIQFPGSNCDHDAFYASELQGWTPTMVWHKDTDLQNPDLVILPGGFSYGDYLRCGALAKFSPIVGEVIKFAHKGGLVIGICNGFQILTESGLLPGALLMNRSLQFICQHQYIKTMNSDTAFTCSIPQGKVMDIPIAHKEGNYYIDSDGLKRLEDEERIIFKYCDKEGNITEKANPNGSLANIAGICSEKGNILGMMPHPERAAEDIVVSHDGKAIFHSIAQFFASHS
ncbi:MAG TPA: phosphoribosylformylglycinamidine synthase I [Candidatus Cloacimonadota bacterium]|nr:phosphoribosylformylglycinamidine synthase I [Candidatus Cloacimonadota bacterium]HPT70710.1 phosphoribosylformylglycinamidine synthase I [Candidatus Cloacimonadota bacterium]